MEITIRQASQSDLEHLVKLHCEAFTKDEHIPMLFGANYIKANYNWLLNSKYSYVLIAESYNEIVGQIAVSDIPFTRPMFITCLPQMLISFVRKP